MWFLAIRSSWQDEQVAVIGEMLRSSEGSVTSEPVSIVEASVRLALSMP